MYETREVLCNNEFLYVTTIRLPINSPYKKQIIVSTFIDTHSRFVVVEYFMRRVFLSIQNSFVGSSDAQ